MYTLYTWYVSICTSQQDRISVDTRRHGGAVTSSLHFPLQYGVVQRIWFVILLGSQTCVIFGQSGSRGTASCFDKTVLDCSASFCWLIPSKKVAMTSKQWYESYEASWCFATNSDFRIGKNILNWLYVIWVRGVETTNQEVFHPVLRNHYMLTYLICHSNVFFSLPIALTTHMLEHNTPYFKKKNKQTDCQIAWYLPVVFQHVSSSSACNHKNDTS